MTDAALRTQRVKWSRDYRERQRKLLPPPEPQPSGADVMQAITNAAGDTAAAAVALGLKRAALNARIRRCTVFIDGRDEPMAAWRLRVWPPKPGRRAVDVARVEYEGTYRARERVYYLAAHGEAAEGAHVVRVPAVGVERQRVVCKVCKEIGMTG